MRVTRGLGVFTVVKSKVKISQDFVAFSEYINYENQLKAQVFLKYLYQGLDGQGGKMFTQNSLDQM